MQNPPQETNTGNGANARNKTLKVGFTIINIVRILAIAGLYLFFSLMGALALSDSNMEVSEKYKLQYSIAIGWLIISFFFDFIQSFTKINLPTLMKFFRMYKFIIFIYILILFSTLIPTFLKYLYL